jgi:hypothetical protein
LPTMSSLSSFPRKWTATKISTAPITMVNSGPRVLLRCEVALITAAVTAMAVVVVVVVDDWINTVPSTPTLSLSSP